MRTNLDCDSTCEDMEDGKMSILEDPNALQHMDALFDVFEDNLTMHGLTVIHSYNKETA